MANLIPYIKEYKSAPELVKLLQSRGVSISDTNKASSRAAKNTTACNISMTLCTSAAAWTWGAAFGGIVGVAVNVAWTIAGSVAAQYTC